MNAVEKKTCSLHSPTPAVGWGGGVCTQTVTTKTKKQNKKQEAGEQQLHFRVRETWGCYKVTNALPHTAQRRSLPGQQEVQTHLTRLASEQQMRPLGQNLLAEPPAQARHGTCPSDGAGLCLLVNQHAVMELQSRSRALLWLTLGPTSCLELDKS